MNDYIEANRRNWDDRVAVHVESQFYDVASFKAGRSTLSPVEKAELGDLRGKALLHLQCHFGMDSLSWAREGAIVTGVDFSANAIAKARELAAELNIEARFVETDVYKLREVLQGSFDIVFASYGVICWVPDLSAWMRIASHFLKPGGVLYLIDGHPMGNALAEDAGPGDLRLGYPYLSAAAFPWDSDRTYTDQRRGIEHTRTYEFAHGLGEIVTSVLDAGLQLEFLHEFPFDCFQRLPSMQRGDDGYWRLPDDAPGVPFLFSVRASKPAI